MKPFNPIRELAKRPEWQALYSRCKELNNINLFENTIDFTPLQINFLQWLEIYHSLEVDLAMKEKYLSKEVIDDEIRCDAYLILKQKQRNKEDKEVPIEHSDSGIPSIIYKN